VSSSCPTTAGQPLTLTFTASGTAYGPYPGTFTEHGTAVVDSANFYTTHAVISWTASFTIDSPVGQVTGAKQFDSTLFSTGGCSTRSVSDIEGDTYAYMAQSSANLTYDATIHTAAAAYRDQGNAYSLVMDDCTGAVQPECRYERLSFAEQFNSSNGLTLLMPTTKEQCKNGGWETYGVFKNQGDCISYVATGGKNPPSGP
jgi:hypothetical protein